MFLFATVNTKKKGELTVEDFQPLVKKVEIKPDLTFKDEKFTINRKFLKDKTELNGFVAVLSGDKTKGYILKSTTPETSEQTKFLRNINSVNIFSSDALELIVKSVGLSLENSLFLHQQESVDGWDVFLIQDTPKVEIEEVTNTEVVQQEQSIVVPETENEILSYAQQEVEELSFSDEPIEDLV